jgi:hypothetical protein
MNNLVSVTDTVTRSLVVSSYIFDKGWCRTPKQELKVEQQCSADGL